MKTKNILLIIAAVFLFGIIAMLTGCKGCNKPQYIPPKAVEVIEKTHNPVIDSLQKVTTILTDSVSKLNAALQKQKVKTEKAESNANVTAQRLKESLNKKDTSEALTYADDIIEEFYNYRNETIKQDSLQELIIEKQAATIVNNRAEIELHESKFAELKRAYNIQDLKLSDYARQNVRLHKKVKRAKFWNKVLGVGTAAGAVLAGIVFL